MEGLGRPPRFDRVPHRVHAVRPARAGLRERGLVDTEGRFTDAGRETKRRIEAVTDELAAPPYAALSAKELIELQAVLDPITTTLVATGSK